MALLDWNGHNLGQQSLWGKITPIQKVNSDGMMGEGFNELYIQDTCSIHFWEEF